MSYPSLNHGELVRIPNQLPGRTCRIATPFGKFADEVREYWPDWTPTQVYNEAARELAKHQIRWNVRGETYPMEPWVEQKIQDTFTPETAVVIEDGKPYVIDGTLWKATVVGPEFTEPVTFSRF